MHGPGIERQFQHIEFEKQQLTRNMESRRLQEAAQQPRERRRPSLVDIFGRFRSRLVPPTPIRRIRATSG